MATKSAERRVMDAVLTGLPPAQGNLLGDDTPPAPIARTGRAGRPKGRKNNRTLMAEANLDTIGEAVLRERTRLALVDPVAEAKRMVAQIHGLPEDADPNTVIREERKADGTLVRIVAFADEVTEMTIRLAGLKENAASNALPFMRQKMPAQIDVTERLIVNVVQSRMIDDGLDDAVERRAQLKNVTPTKEG